MILGIDPKVDYAFKRIFGQERNRAILIHILNAILLLRRLAPITELDLLNPFNDKETSDDKLSIVDVKARDQDGRRFNVEMQMLAQQSFPDRVVYYWSRLHPQQMYEGMDYAQLSPTFSICFLNEILFPELPDYHSCFQLREEKHPEILFSEHLEIHLFELPKFQLTAENLHTPLEKWLYFLKNAAGLDTEAFPASLQVPEILQAFQELIMVTQDERDRARYEDRFKAEMDARHLKSLKEETQLLQENQALVAQELEKKTLALQEEESLLKEKSLALALLEEKTQSLLKEKSLALALLEEKTQSLLKEKALALALLEEKTQSLLKEKALLEETMHKEVLVDRIHWFQKLLRQSQTPKDDLKTLPEAELQQLNDLLEQQVASGFRPPNGTA